MRSRALSRAWLPDEEKAISAAIASRFGTGAAASSRGYGGSHGASRAHPELKESTKKRISRPTIGLRRPGRLANAQNP